MNKVQDVITRPLYKEPQGENHPDFFPDPAEQKKLQKKPNELWNQMPETLKNMGGWNWTNIGIALASITAATGLYIAVHKQNGDLIKTFGKPLVGAGISAASQAMQNIPPQYVMPTATAVGTTLATGLAAKTYNTALDWQAKSLINKYGGMTFGTNSNFHNNLTLTKLLGSNESTQSPRAYNRAIEMLHNEVDKPKK